MRLLLDTHSLLWAIFEPKKLSIEAQEVIANKNSVAYTSIASLWEIAIKRNLGRLDVPDNFFDAIEYGGYELLNITIPHIKDYTSLPLHHRDPFDRILIAQAISERLTLITRDKNIDQYDISIIRA